jgi:hypothetical protein
MTSKVSLVNNLLQSAESLCFVLTSRSKKKIIQKLRLLASKHKKEMTNVIEAQPHSILICRTGFNCTRCMSQYLLWQVFRYTYMATSGIK